MASLTEPSHTTKLAVCSLSFLTGQPTLLCSKLLRLLLSISNNKILVTYYSAFSYAYQNLTYALQKTSMSKLEALSGLFPLVFFYTEAVIVFTTEWGQSYPALAVMLLMPSYCLMTCRHIICSVTRMIFDWRQLNPLWFLLFIANKALIPIIRKLYI